MKHTILNGWNFARVLRLALGIFILFQGVVGREWLFALAGGLFSLMSLLNIGCCGVAGCDTPVSKRNKK